MIDDSFLGNPFEKEGKLKPEVPINTNYVAIQLKEFSDVFDYQNSIYKADLVFPEEIGQIEKLVLKNPNLGFPPIFKIKEAPQHLFVSDEAKIELERKKYKVVFSKKSKSAKFTFQSFPSKFLGYGLY